MILCTSDAQRDILVITFYSDGCILLSFKAGSPLPIRDLRSDQSQCEERGFKNEISKENRIVISLRLFAGLFEVSTKTHLSSLTIQQIAIMIFSFDTCLSKIFQFRKYHILLSNLYSSLEFEIVALKRFSRFRSWLVCLTMKVKW